MTELCNYFITWRTASHTFYYTEKINTYIYLVELEKGAGYSPTNIDNASHF